MSQLAKEHKVRSTRHNVNRATSLDQMLAHLHNPGGMSVPMTSDVVCDHRCHRASSFLPVLCVDTCLLYTSDAADEEDSVDLGGRRIIKKKKIYKSNKVCKPKRLS
eukprot:TRINITY_DN9579_c0_g1_i1.p2 TRINITY_DN9579_c0_g1~~TRINITY_DN9579_c0_g1_i1.p2  ORF type:complete len:106 (-),score=17.61 TRINITY_DN9579_c0_g1_i1:49-366(-)